MSQMQRLDEFVANRHEVAKRYDELFADMPVVTPWQDADSYSSFHLYVIRLKLSEISKSQREVFDTLRTAGILANLHYIPVYRQPYYERLGFVKDYCPEADRYYTEAVSLPMYPGLTEVQQDRVIEILRRVTEK